MQLLQPVNKLLARVRRAPPAPMPRSMRVLYTHGDDLLTPGQYRASFEQALSRSLRRDTAIDDEYLARAFAVANTAFACTQYSATTAAGIPLKVTDAADNDLENTPFTYFLKVAPLFLANAVRSLRLWGRLYARKRYNTAGYPTGLEWISPMRIREVTDGKRRVIGYDVMNEDGVTRERVDARQILYAEDFDPRPDGNGLSRFEAAWLSLNIEQNIATYAAAFFVNGAQPDGFLTFEDGIGQSELDDARREWKSNFQGSRNAHRTAVMPGGAKWTAMQGVPKDLAMETLSNLEAARICAVFEVDPVLVGLKDASDPLSANSTYNAAEIAHIRRAAIPLLEMVILPALNTQWAQTDFDRRDYTLTVDEANIPALAEANLVKADTAVTLTSSGLLDYDEGRKLVGKGERDSDYPIRRNPDNALALWQAATISLNEFRALVGLNPLPQHGDMFNVEGVGLMPSAELPNLWRYKLLVAPSVYNSELITGEPLPQPADPNEVIPTITGGEPVAPDVEANPKPTPEPFASVMSDVSPAPQPATLSVQRAGIAYELAIPLAGHQFAVYARRALSDYLTAQGVSAEWIPDSDWRLTLAQGVGTPAELGTLLVSLDYGDARKVDATAGGYSAAGNAIYWRVGSSDGLNALRASTALAAGASVETPGVLLCRTSAPVDLSNAPADTFPLVLSGVTLYKLGEPVHTWQLRGLSKAQDKELKDYAHVIARKGVDYPFRSEHLPAIVRAYITLALEDGEVIDDVFAAARGMLGEATRAYVDTKQAFADDIRASITRGQASEVSRQKFAGEMRSALRRYGLLAYRDGMQLTGHNPESFSVEELATFRDWQARQSAFVTNFGAEVFGQGITETEIDLRVAYWSGNSLDEIYYLGVRAGNGVARFRWDLGTAEHCPDCLRLAGQVHTIDEWERAGYRPRNGATECNVGCKCTLSLTDEPVRGSF